MDKITYELMNSFIEAHPDDIGKTMLYRYMYLCVKSMVVDGNYDDLEKVFAQSKWLDNNLGILKDLLIEEDFAHSKYKHCINRAVAILVDEQRRQNHDYNDDFNELIGLNNVNMFDKSDTTRKFFANEMHERQLPILYRIAAHRHEDVFKKIFGFDAYVYQSAWIEGEIPEYNGDDKKVAKAYNYLVKSSIKKISGYYMDIDRFSRILEKDE